jgi:hypothetical protein
VAKLVKGDDEANANDGEGDLREGQVQQVLQHVSTIASAPALGLFLVDDASSSVVMCADVGAFNDWRIATGSSVH